MQWLLNTCNKVLGKWACICRALHPQLGVAVGMLDLCASSPVLLQDRADLSPAEASDCSWLVLGFRADFWLCSPDLALGRPDLADTMPMGPVPLAALASALEWMAIT